MQTTQKIDIDIGDYLKLAACSAVILQTILALALTTFPTTIDQIGIGMTYNLVKFTAPAFIFGILYTTIRKTTTPQTTYGHYLKRQWHNLFVPTLWWTSIYLLVTSALQQGHHYTTWQTFLWQFINGNAAPHLWYNTMMLQFIVLMPFFWFLSHWVNHHVGRAWLLTSVTLLAYLAWLVFYDQQVFHGPHMNSWYLLDRVFISFIIYGLFGCLAWQFHNAVNHFLKTWWPFLCLGFLASFYWINRELLAYGIPVNLKNAPYYKPSMMLYDLLTIALIATAGLFQIQAKLSITKIVHFLATYAYKAFLSNVFWLFLMWRTFGKWLVIDHLVIGIITLYILTWLLSFGSALLIHSCWQPLNHLWQRQRN